MEYEKLDPKFKTDWIEALRSGNYEQGKGYLKQGNNYCCLGVACKVAGVENYKIEDQSLIYGIITSVYPLLNPLKNMSGSTIDSILAEMNDEGQSFEEIANWIEINL